MKNSETILYNYLVESSDMTKDEVIDLNEDVKIDSLKSVASKILKSIYDSAGNLDTTPIDASRGDIRRLRELEYIQNILERIDRYTSSLPSVDKKLEEYYGAVTKAIGNLYKNADAFRDAYRMKKTVLVLKYQSIVLAICEAVNYMSSKVFNLTNRVVEFNNNAKLEDTTALKTLIDFNKSVLTSDFGKSVKDVNMMREFYVEIDSQTMRTILEAGDIMGTIMNGVSNIYRNLDQGGKTTNLIYKAAGIITSLLSVREIFYAISKSRFKIQEMFDSLKMFATVGLPGTASSMFNKLLQFSNRFVPDVEENTKVAEREVVSQDSDISKEIKAIATAPVQLNKPDDIDEPKPVSAHLSLQMKNPSLQGSNNNEIDSIFNF